MVNEWSATAVKLSEVSRVLRVDDIPLCQRLESDSKTPESRWFHAPWRSSRLERTYVRLVAMVAQEGMVRDHRQTHCFDRTN